MARNPLRAVLVLLLALFAASPALAGPPHRFVVFGDSLSDPGNAFILTRDLEIPPFTSLIPSAPYARGALHFSNGPTWIEQLSLIDRALPSAGPALLLPVVLSNYAVGGARARTVGAFDLPTQVGLFVGDFHGQAPANALYVVFVGGNDVRDALTALATDPTGATSVGIVSDALSAIRGNLLTLYAAGARKFLVPNLPDVGLTPAVRLAGPQAQGLAHLFSTQFNAGLELTLQGLEAALGVSIVRLDVFGLVNQAVADPAAFGLADVEDPCIRLNTVVNAFCANPGKFFFWDGIHPTVAVHRLFALRANDALKADAAVAAR
ncbi:MAG TPA: SGNH/GDSL hydrolase family protein [Burkholderiales bacterium]|nr:SGNH/GDSL hydrolase family protein [Burkholderiales bacterium]